MTCVDSGTLRAYVDAELPEERWLTVQRHIAGCDACRHSVDEMRETSSWAEARMASLGPFDVPDLTASLPRLRARMAEERARRTPFERLIRVFALPQRRQGYRLALLASTLVLVLAAALAFSPVRSAAEGFLSVFRVQKFEAVRVDPSIMPKVPPPTSLGQFTLLREPKFESNVSFDDAQKSVDFRLRVPGRTPSMLLPTPTTLVSGDGEAGFTIDLRKVNDYLASLGATNVSLSPSLDGATIKARLSPNVVLAYADRPLGDLKNQEPTVLSSGLKVLLVSQGRSPVMEVPSNLDLEQVRSQILQIPGLPPEFVAQVRGIQDWRTTALVPVIGGTSRDISVDGTNGILITSTQLGMTVVLWQKNEVLYAVAGNIAESEIMGVANSLK